MRALVIDVGTTSIRTSIVDESGSVEHVQQRPLTVQSPQPGEVQLDGDEIAQLAIDLSEVSISDGGHCEVVGIANQRATTIVFDSTTGAPVGPALGWQDLRTVIDCLILQGSGVRLAPNQSATKAKWLIERFEGNRTNLRFATLETFLAWHLTRGDAYVSDHSNAAVTGLVAPGALTWDDATLAAVGLERSMMPEVVNTMGEYGCATALPGAPRLTALVGDQSASLYGQSCVSAGATKITLGSGAMLDLVRGHQAAETFARFPSGCFPIVARSRAGHLIWGVEGIMLSAGTCIEWLRDDLGLIQSASETEPLARSVDSTGGVSFVPALLGLGTPKWDFGARGAFFGLTRGSTRAHLVRSVLEGIAQRGADLVDAARAETAEPIVELRVDGGMSANSLLLQMLADHSGCLVAASSQREATTKGAGLMALTAVGAVSEHEVESMWRPSQQFEPTTSADERLTLRTSWSEVVTRAEKTIPELSSVSF